MKTSAIYSYKNIKKTGSEKKSKSFGQLENILIHYFIIYEKIRKNNFDWDKLLFLTRALS